jgi:hypothetical protein
LQLLLRHNLKAKRTKCEFFKPELKFLGHIVSAKGMSPDPKKVAVIQDWPVPGSVYEVRSFLGLANYFRKYIRGYAGMTAPLTDLLKGLDKQDRKGKLMHWHKVSPAQAAQIKECFAKRWTPTCLAAFQAVKHALMSAPVLVSPDYITRALSW